MYYASLSSQFEALRAQLYGDPPSDLVATLDKDHGTHVGHFGARSWTFRVWNHRIRYTDPSPVQIAAMDRRDALKLLRVILGGKFIRRGYELRKRKSCWIWALLARLPERGEMDYTEIGWVRELGKRAVLLMVSMAQMAALREEIKDDFEGEEIEGGDHEEGFLEEVEVNDKDEFVGDTPYVEPNHPGPNEAAQRPDDAAPQPSEELKTDDDGETDMDIDDGEVSDDSTAPRDIKADIAAAKARLLAQLDNCAAYDADQAQAENMEQTADDDFDEEAMPKEAKAQVNMRATLNMILTVAGEFYGQRDLLEFRDPFPAL